MGHRAIISAAVVWFLGILIPVLHHSLLMLAVVPEEGHLYSARTTMKAFWSLPWLIWVYVLDMFLLGLLLVICGLRAAKPAS